MKREYTPEEVAFLEDYKKKVQSGAYPVQMITVDPIVVWQNQVLLVKRGAFPGKGLLALPGGFVNLNERLLDAAIRECREETNVSLNKEWLYRSQYFDDPERSSRGRILTHAFAFEVPFYFNRPEVKAGDDASEASWYNVHTILLEGSKNYEMFHDDHFWILCDMIGRKQYKEI